MHGITREYLKLFPNGLTDPHVVWNQIHDDKDVECRWQRWTCHYFLNKRDLVMRTHQPIVWSDISIDMCTCTENTQESGFDLLKLIENFRSLSVYDCNMHWNLWYEWRSLKLQQNITLLVYINALNFWTLDPAHQKKERIKHVWINSSKSNWCKNKYGNKITKKEESA